MDRVDITIIGAGVIGLAAAFELSKTRGNIFVIEKNLSFGQETSSRNSEVIHAGIHYPKGSLKARTCVDGRRLLYEFCERHSIPHRRIGKLIVATDADEAKDLEGLFKDGLENGADGLTLIDKSEVKKLEPNVEAEAAIYSASTGILDSHAFMKGLLSEFKSRGGEVVFNTEVVGIDKIKEGFKLYVEDKREGEFAFLTRALINCAGLNSDKVARMIGIERDDYRLKYCKGDYFRAGGGKAELIRRLVYPVPKKEGAGLGIHATLDLGGGLRFGPDDEYVERIDYSVDGTKRGLFCESVKKYLPAIEPEDLTADTSGIRPKLQGHGEGFRDFLITEEAKNGFPALINLIGVESPGLTGCLSIAKIVDGMLANMERA